MVLSRVKRRGYISRSFAYVRLATDVVDARPSLTSASKQTTLTPPLTELAMIKICAIRERFSRGCRSFLDGYLRAPATIHQFSHGATFHRFSHGAPSTTYRRPSPSIADCRRDRRASRVARRAVTSSVFDYDLATRESPPPPPPPVTTLPFVLPPGGGGAWSVVGLVAWRVREQHLQ